MNRFERRTISLVVALFIGCTVNLRGQSFESDDEKGANEDVEGREKFRFMMRANEQGVIPSNALANAKAQMDQLRMAQSARFKKSLQRAPQDAGILGWEWLGPGNIGGRIRTILISPDNPSIMWVGSVSGGIWRSDNGGAWWYPVDDFMKNLAVTSLVMDPTDHNVMYAATGEGNYSAHAVGPLRGAGIFKSIDGGFTWSQLPSTNNVNFLFVIKLAHNPLASNSLIAATRSGLWQTFDGGANWNLLLPNSTYPGSSLPFDVAYHPTDSSRILVGGFGGDVYYSTNGGGNWVSQTTGSPMLPASGTADVAVAFAKSTNYMYVSMNRNKGEIYRTTNNGSSWNLMSTGRNYLSQGFTNSIWVDPFDANTVINGGFGSARSTDGGSTWVDISPPHSDVHVFVNHPGYDGSTNRTVYIGDDGGINEAQDIRTITKGEWLILNHNLGITQFYGGAAAPDGSIIIGGTQDNKQVHYRPAWGTDGWTSSTSPITGDAGYSAVNPGNPNTIYGEGQNLDFARSTNGGSTYTSKQSGLGDARNASLTAFVAPFVMDPNNPSILVAGGTSIWRTIDSADNWSSIRSPIASNPVCTAIDIQKGSSLTIWVGYSNGTVSNTTNGGASWTNVNGGITPLPARAVTDIAINPFDGNEAFVTFGGYSPDDVWRTVDFGTSWTQRTGSGSYKLPALQVNTVRFNPLEPNWVYVGTDLGVFASEDKGLTWSITPLYGGNEGPVNVEVDELFWQGTGYLIAATHGRGMFRTHIVPYVYVDINNNGFQDGTQQYPFHQIQDAVNSPGWDIIINPGDYVQAPITISRHCTLIAPSGNVVVRK